MSRVEGWAGWPTSCSTASLGQLVQHVGLQRGDRDGVHRDAVRGELLGQHGRQGHRGGLAGSVDGLADWIEHRCDRPDVDDAPPRPPSHELGRLARDIETAQQVGADHLLGLRCRRHQRVPNHHDRGVVDDDVHPSVRPADRQEGLPHAPVITDIGRVMLVPRVCDGRLASD